MNLFRRKNLSDRLKDEAIALGLCDAWQQGWHDNSSEEELAAKFISGIDFTIKHDWPKPVFIKKNFRADFLHKWGIYIDEHVVLTTSDCQRRTLVFLGDCDCCCKFSEFDTKDIYVRHSSRLSIKIGGNARVHVNIYNDAFVDIDAAETSKVFVYQHGGKLHKKGPIMLRLGVKNV